MIVAYTKADVIEYMGVITEHVDMDHPVLLDKYILGTECEVDAICDGENFLIPGIMEQVERTGVHSGDSACSLPPYTLSKAIQDEMREQVRKLALELGVVGLMNVQFAVKDNEIYLIEVNPRAARTVPFVSKATGAPLAKTAANPEAMKAIMEIIRQTNDGREPGAQLKEGGKYAGGFVSVPSEKERIAAENQARIDADAQRALQRGFAAAPADSKMKGTAFDQLPQPLNSGSVFRTSQVSGSQQAPSVASN